MLILTLLLTKNLLKKKFEKSRSERLIEKKRKKKDIRICSSEKIKSFDVIVLLVVRTFLMGCRNFDVRKP